MKHSVEPTNSYGISEAFLTSASFIHTWSDTKPLVFLLFSEREEKERIAREEKERREAEETERKAKLDEMERKKREKEREIEEREKNREEETRKEKEREDKSRSGRDGEFKCSLIMLIFFYFLLTAKIFWD